MRVCGRWAWGWLVGLAAAGCAKDDEAAGPEAPSPGTVAAPAPAAPEPPVLPVVLPPPEVGPPGEISPPPPIFLDVPFEHATTTAAPAGSNPPPDRTAAGKPTAALRQEVQRLWHLVRLTAPAGEIEPIRLTLATELGPVELAVFPEHAPNHVRNLLVLAHLGYYDGLAFERLLKTEVSVEGGPKQRIEVLTLGCPVGDGDRSRGHLGYFVKYEPSRIDHREGTIGFVRGGDENSACCRLYVCLADSPALNERFTAVGHVTHGMDVIKAIAARPVKAPGASAEAEPVAPVKIGSLRVK